MSVKYSATVIGPCPQARLAGFTVHSPGIERLLAPPTPDKTLMASEHTGNGAASGTTSSEGGAGQDRKIDYRE
jgi:hypothetical protein